MSHTAKDRHDIDWGDDPTVSIPRESIAEMMADYQREPLGALPNSCGPSTMRDTVEMPAIAWAPEALERLLDDVQTGRAAR